jgi:hypothetical protein
MTNPSSMHLYLSGLWLACRYEHIPKGHMFQHDSTKCLEYRHYIKVNNEHKWDDLYCKRLKEEVCWARKIKYGFVS